MAISIAIKQYWGNTQSGVYEEMRMLYDAHAATDDGVWLDMKGVELLQAQVGGSSPVGTVLISGSYGTDSKFTIPANSSDGDYTIATITNGGQDITRGFDIPRYVKVHLSAFTSGTFDVFLKIVRKAQ